MQSHRCSSAPPEGVVVCNQADVSKVIRCCGASRAVEISALPAQDTHLRCKSLLLWHRSGLQHKPARKPYQSRASHLTECVRCPKESKPVHILETKVTWLGSMPDVKSYLDAPSIAP